MRQQQACDERMRMRAMMMMMMITRPCEQAADYGWEYSKEKQQLSSKKRRNGVDEDRATL